MAFGARDLLVIYFPISLIYGLLPLRTMGRLVWWRLTYPRHLTVCGMRHCSPSSPPLGFLLLFAYLCLAFFLIVPFRLLCMGRLLHFLSTVVILRVLSSVFSAAHLTLSIHMTMTRLSILLLISNLLPLLHLELP